MPRRDEDYIEGAIPFSRGLSRTRLIELPEVVIEDKQTARLEESGGQDGVFEHMFRDLQIWAAALCSLLGVFSSSNPLRTTTTTRPAQSPGRPLAHQLSGPRKNSSSPLLPVLSQGAHIVALISRSVWHRSCY